MHRYHYRIIVIINPEIVAIIPKSVTSWSRVRVFCNHQIFFWIELTNGCSNYRLRLISIWMSHSNFGSLQSLYNGGGGCWLFFSVIYNLPFLWIIESNYHVFPDIHITFSRLEMMPSTISSMLKVTESKNGRIFYINFKLTKLQINMIWIRMIWYDMINDCCIPIYHDFMRNSL